jgi:hypothetical protein
MGSSIPTVPSPHSISLVPPLIRFGINNSGVLNAEGSFTLINVPGANVNHTIASGINDSGLIVGWSTTAPGMLNWPCGGSPTEISA